MMPQGAAQPLKIRLFGTFHVLCAGHTLPKLRSQKGKWLLTLLILQHGREVQRGWLASVLWPDSDGAQDSLNTTLFDLRHALGPEAGRLTVARRTLSLDLAGADVDLLAFDAAIAAGDIASLRTAVALYTAPFLADCSELWAIHEREARADVSARALETLAMQAQTDGDRTAEIDILRRAVATEADREITHRRLMQALADTGDYSGASQVYDHLAQRKQAQLGAVPEEATTALYRHLRLAAHRRASGGGPNRTPPPEAAPFRSRIPRPLTPLLGRDRELQAVVARLLSARLVTLVGTGGVGKTRLATEAALSAAHEFAHGAHFVRLDGLADPQRLPQQLAQALCIEAAAHWTAALVDFLCDRHLLLVLDNCEHLLDGCAHLARTLLGECAGLHILATSRERLGLTGELKWDVQPLAVPDLPDAGAIPDIEQCLQFPALRLFHERATAVRPRLALQEEDVADMIRICRRLDGLPLAIELAAALAESLSVREIAARIDDDRFHLLQAGDRTAPQRHQALAATLGWSHDLLAVPEQRLLGCLCVFAGGWTLAAAEALAPAAQVRPHDVLALQARLIAKSFVFVQGDSGAERYGMLETIREYGHERPGAQALLREARQRHCEFYTALAESAEPHLTGADQLTWMAALDAEMDNLRAALTWGLSESGDAALALRLGAALSRYWYGRGYLDEGQAWLERIVSRSTDQPLPLRYKATQGLGNLCYARDANAEARQYYADGLALAEAMQDRRAQASALASLANVEVDERRIETARLRFEAALCLFRELEDVRGTALTLSNLAMLACAEEEYAVARELHEQGLALFRKLGAQQNIAHEANNYAHTLLNLHEIEGVPALLAESLQLSRALKNLPILAHCLTNYRSLAVMTGDVRRAATLMGAEFALRERIDFPLPANARAACEREDAVLRTALDAAEYEACLRQGREMSDAQIDQYARNRSGIR